MSAAKELLLKQTHDAFESNDEMSLVFALRNVMQPEASWPAHQVMVDCLKNCDGEAYRICRTALQLN